MGKDDSRKFLVKEDGTTEFEKTKVKEAVVKSEEKKVGGTLLGLRVPGVTSALEIPEKDFQEGRRTAIGDIVERPGAAVRAGARGLIPGGEKPLEAFQRASIDPGTEPRFQDSFLDQTPLGQLNAAIQRGNIPANKLTSGLAFAEEVGRGFVPSSAG